MKSFRPQLSLYTVCMVSSCVRKIRLGRAVSIGLDTVLEAILMGKQAREKLQWIEWESNVK